MLEGSGLGRRVGVGSGAVALGRGLVGRPEVCAALSMAVFLLCEMKRGKRAEGAEGDL